MKRLKIQLLAFALVILAATGAFASTSYNITVDTSSLSGSGYLYMQYIPVNAADSTATVSNFATDGVLAASDSSNVVDGDAVSGSLTVSPYTVTFANTNGINDYNHGITFGSTISMVLTLSDPVSGGVSGGVSTFSLTLTSDEGNASPLLVTGDGYALFTINLMNDGSTSSETFVSQAHVSPVPVPAAVWLLGSGLLGLGGIKRGKRA